MKEDKVRMGRLIDAAMAREVALKVKLICADEAIRAYVEKFPGSNCFVVTCGIKTSPTISYIVEAQFVQASDRQLSLENAWIQRTVWEVTLAIVIHLDDGNTMIVGRNIPRDSRITYPG